jgi:hypothetical protein
VDEHKLNPANVQEGEKKFTIHYIFQLKDGSTIWEFQSGFYANPDEIDVTVDTMLVETISMYIESGFASVYPDKRFALKDGELTEIPVTGPVVIPWHSIEHVSEHIDIADLTEAQIQERIDDRARAAQHRELREMAQKAEAEERAKGVPVPDSSASELIVSFSQPQHVGKGNVKGIGFHVVYADSSQDFHIYTPSAAHELGHALLEIHN